MAYVVENDAETGKYDLYIGAKGGVIANDDSNWLFQGFTGVKSINFNDNFDTNNAASMYALFCGDIYSETLDLSSFNTFNVASMGAMFMGGTER